MLQHAKAKSSSFYWQSRVDLWHNPCVSIKLSESNEVRRNTSHLSSSSAMILHNVSHFTKEIDSCLHCSFVNS